MIGVGWMEGGKWVHKSFICDKLNTTEENRIMNEFYNFTISRGNPTLYYWSAEENFWNNSRKKQFGLEISETNNPKLNWMDMRNIFVKEPISIHGVFGFGLKPIVKKMNEYGMIDLSMESECKDGMMAMVKMWYTYEQSRYPSKSPVMKDVSNYNEFDCLALQKILCSLLTFSGRPK